MERHKRVRRLYQSDTHGWKMIPWRILVGMPPTFIHLSESTAVNPYPLTLCEAKLKTSGWHVFIPKRGKNPCDNLCSLICQVNIVLVFIPTAACTGHMLCLLVVLGDLICNYHIFLLETCCSCTLCNIRLHKSKAKSRLFYTKNCFCSNLGIDSVIWVIVDYTLIDLFLY